MRYLLIQKGQVQNAIELDPKNITETFILNDRGDRLPTTIVNGQTIVSTRMYLPPEGFDLEQSDVGDVGMTWPIPADQVGKTEVDAKLAALAEETQL